VYVGQSGGRLACFGVEPNALWSAKLSNDGELACAPLVEPGRVYAVATDGAVVSIAPSDGGIAWRTALGAKVNVAASRSNDGILVATDDGRVHLVDSGTGAVRGAWPAGPRPSGGVVLVGSTIAVGTADGRIRLLDYRSARTDERFVTLGVRPSGLAVHRDVLFAAGDDGTLVGLEMPAARTLYRIAGGSIAWPRPVVGNGRILSDVAGRLAALDPRTGAVLATCSRATAPMGAPAISGTRVAAAMRDGSVVSLRADDLSLEWLWPGDGGAPSLAASEGVVFAVVGRKLFRFPIAP
jgi:outer membrane protein assembly factor BamB